MRGGNLGLLSPLRPCVQPPPRAGPSPPSPSQALWALEVGGAVPVPLKLLGPIGASGPGSPGLRAGVPGAFALLGPRCRLGLVFRPPGPLSRGFPPLAGRPSFPPPSPGGVCGGVGPRVGGWLVFRPPVPPRGHAREALGSLGVFGHVNNRKKNT